MGNIVRGAVSCALAGAFVGSTLVAVPAQAVVDGNFTSATSWGTNGRVSTILVAQDRVYIGGTFTAVVDPTGTSSPVSNVAAYIPSEQRFDTSWHPQVQGSVEALALSNDAGTLYMGGAITRVNGLARSKFAAVWTGNGRVSPAAPVFNGSVDALAVAPNGLVYAGGKFSSVTDSAPRTVSNVVRLTPQGAVDTSWAPAPNDRVHALAVGPDGVYLGGDFSHLGSSRRTSVGKVDLATGAQVTNFTVPAYDLGRTPPIFGMHLKGDRLYLASGGAGGACSSIRISTGTLMWSYHANGDMEAVSAGNGTVWCGGHFDGSTSFGGQPRKKLAAVDEATGAIMPYAPVIDTALGVHDVSAAGDGAYVGGDFSKVTPAKVAKFARILPTSDRTSPTAPVDLGGRATNGAASIFWDVPNSDNGAAIGSYGIWRRVNGGAWLRVGTTTAKVRAFSQSGLTNGRTYEYMVRAINAAGPGAQSETVTIVPTNVSSAPSSEPRALSVTSVAGQAQLSWVRPLDDGGSALTGYVVQRLVTDTWQDIATVSPSQTSHTDSSVAIGDVPTYRVVAVNANGAGAPSAEVSTEITADVPASPVLTGGLTDAGVALSWNLPADGGSPIKNFTVVRNSLQIGRITYPGTSFTDTTAQPGVTYTYQVRATNSLGNSPLSNKIVVTR